MTDLHVPKMPLRCSDCSNQIRPLVAMDIDGTLGDYHQHFGWFISRYFDIHLPDNPWDGGGDFEDYLGISKAKYREAKLSYRQGGMKRWMPAYAGSKNLVDQIRAHAELWIATSRPWQRLDNIDPDTIEWLRRNGLTFDGLVYGEDKYEILLGAIETDRVVAVVDDLPEQINKANKLGLHSIQRWNYHNAHFSTRMSPGSNNLNDISGMILKRIRSWRIQHGVS